MIAGRVDIFDASGESIGSHIEWPHSKYIQLFDSCGGNIRTCTEGHERTISVLESSRFLRRALTRTVRGRAKELVSACRFRERGHCFVDFC